MKMGQITNDDELYELRNDIVMKIIYDVNYVMELWRNGNMT